MRCKVQQFTSVTAEHNEDIEKMRTVLTKVMEKRFQLLEANELIDQATILDKRFKKYGLFDERIYLEKA